MGALTGSDELLQEKLPLIEKLINRTRMLSVVLLALLCIVVVVSFLSSGFLKALGWAIQLGVTFFLIHCAYTFIAARRVDSLLQRLKDLAGREQSLCKEPDIADSTSRNLVFPFLERNDVPLFGWTDIPDGEIHLLQNLLISKGIAVPPERLSLYLKTCALKRDYLHFADRLRHFNDPKDQIVRRYAELYPQERDSALVPYLQQYLAESGEAPERKLLLEKLQHHRREFRMSGFEKDLELRRQTGSYSISIQEVDRMDPFNFELLLGTIFGAQGYMIEETPKSGDQGADVLLERAGERTVVQAKLYGHPVSNSAVQEAVAAKRLYGCHYATVVTNSTFTVSAVALAESNRVKLIDREELSELIEQFNRSPKDYARLAGLMVPRSDTEWPQQTEP